MRKRSDERAKIWMRLKRPVEQEAQKPDWAEMSEGVLVGRRVGRGTGCSSSSCSTGPSKESKAFKLKPKVRTA